MPVTFVVHVSPALTGIASVNVPVEITSPARLSGVKQTLQFQGGMSAVDPKRTFPSFARHPD
jgi:hypothetical protein